MLIYNKTWFEVIRIIERSLVEVVISSHLHCTGNLVERDIRLEDVLDLVEKFNDVLFVSRNNANLVERSTVNTNDILVLGEKINDSLIVSE